MNSNRIIVEKVINGGFGLARDESGRVILLRNCLAGEELSFTITEERRGTLFGIPDIIYQPSSARITPPCEYYGQCGGCDLQHASYPEQLSIKEAILHELVRNDRVNCLPIVPSPKQFEYRQRIRLQVQNAILGFHRYRSKNLVAIDRCLLAHPCINRALKEVRGITEFNRLLEICSEVEFLYNPTAKDIVLFLHITRKPRPSDRKKVASIITHSSDINRIFFKGSDFAAQPHHGKQPVNISEKQLSFSLALENEQVKYTLSWEAGGFCQVNLEQNQSLINFIYNNSLSLNAPTILDLYCGMGNFSIALAQGAHTLLGVENQGSAIRCAKQNSSAAGFTNTEFLQGESTAVCTRLVDEKRIFDLTIVDPPRQGIPNLHSQLSLLTRKKLIYISCDPATLARDLDILQDNDFTLKLIRPFDMFPQTHHIESVAILEKH